MQSAWSLHACARHHLRIRISSNNIIQPHSQALTPVATHFFPCERGENVLYICGVKRNDFHSAEREDDALLGVQKAKECVQGMRVNNRITIGTQR